LVSAFSFIEGTIGGGRRKPDIRDISRQAPDKKEIDQLIDALVKSDAPPIVTAILGVALLEHDLETLLRPRFRASENTVWALMTGDNGPLSTFNQKVIAAHGFGLIDECVRKNLTIVAAVRNAFAHSKKLITFDEAVVGQKLRTIRLPEKHKSALGKALKQVLKEKMPNQARYVILCLELSTHMTRVGNRRLQAQVSSKRRRLKKITQTMNWFAQHMTPTQRAFGQGFLGQFQNVDPTTQVSPPTYAERIIRAVEGPDD
jgi:hypothetical protein